MQGFCVYRQIAHTFNHKFQIDKASTDDLEKVCSWLNPDGRTEDRRPNPNVTNFVAKRKSRVIGFVQLVRHPPEHHPYIGYWLFSLSVRLRYRGLGIGEALSQAVIEKAREKGAEELLLLIHDDNKPAVHLYHKLGFEKKSIPALDSKLEEEYHITGRRRLVMGVSLR